MLRLPLRLRQFLRWLGGMQLGDRGRQSASVTDRAHAQFNQIALRQLAQRLPVDVVVRESLGVLAHPKAPEPYGHIHVHYCPAK